MNAPGIIKQNGDKGGVSGRVTRGVRRGGKNQGKVSGAHSRYSAHPRKRGQ